MDRNQPKVINQKQKSRRIDSEDKLVNYIRTMLGEPMISVEVSDDQILLIIDDTVRKFSDFAYGGEQLIGFVVEGRSDIQDYRLDERIQSIQSISWGNSLGSRTSSGGSGISLGAFGTVGVGYIPHITTQGEVSSLVGDGQASSTSGVGGGVASGGGMDTLTNAMVIQSQIDSLNSLVSVGVNHEFNANTKILRVFEDISGPFIIEASIEYVPNPEYDEIYSHSWIKDYAVASTKLLWGTVTGKYSQSLVGGGEINYADMKSEAETKIAELNEDLLNKYSEALGVFSG